MQLALTMNPFVDSDLLYAQQLGVSWIVGDLPAWDYDTMAAARNRVEQSGLYLSGLACLPPHLLADGLLDDPTRRTAVEQVCQIITDAGKLCIPTLGYTLFHAPPTWDLKTTTGRGGAVSVVYENFDREHTALQDNHEVMWQSLTGFLNHILPVAETAGVRLAYRTEIAAGALPMEARILDSVNELDRLFQAAPSANHGLDLDHGFLTQVLLQQTGLRAGDVIQHFGKQNKILAVRMRNLRRTVHGSQEFFMDEDKVNVLRALQAYIDCGFEGALCPVAAPDMTDDTVWRHKGYAFSIGYLRGLLQAIEF